MADNRPMTFVIATFYHLTPLDDAAALQAPLKAQMLAHGVTGTILVTPEGVNATIAGRRDGVDAVLAYLRADARLAAMPHKESFAESNPFPRTKVKLKRETIPLGVPTNPAMVGSYVKPTDWNALISRPDVVLVDSRNDYEFAVGRFAGAADPATRTFTQLPEWLNTHLPADKATPVAMYCTGGIRCEKSTAYLRALGYENVYHLEGGILKYLEDVPAAESLWQGGCYVFDDRVAVDHALAPMKGLATCRHCSMPLVAAEVKRAEGANVCDRCRHGGFSTARAAECALPC